MATTTRLGQLLRRWHKRADETAEARQKLTDDLLHELVLVHEERAAQKQALAPEQLCRQCPELLPQFLAMRQQLEKLDDILGNPPASRAPEAPPPPRPAFRPNSVPAFSPLQRLGQYELLSLVGKGGMATVYRARNVQTGQIVAVKVMPPEYNRNAVFLKRFEQEFNASRRINHPNVVRALEYCGGEVPFLVMEYVEGQTLGDRLSAEGALSEAEAVRVIAQICLGLHRAHQLGLIHRDVKPHNILVRGDGVAKLADLGLVKDTHAEMGLTRPGVGFGTLHFMAPEQHVDANRVDHRCDIFSLGATLYMMVTGESPYGQDYAPMNILENKRHNRITSPRLVVPELSEHLDWAIRRSMRADPAQRPASCREFLEDLTGRSRRFIEERSEDRWYLRFRDAEGNECLARHSTATARQCLERGLLGNLADVTVSMTAEGPFAPLRQVAEFRDLVGQPAQGRP